MTQIIVGDDLGIEAARLFPKHGVDMLMQVVSKVAREESARFVVF